MPDRPEIEAYDTGFVPDAGYQISRGCDKQLLRKVLQKQFPCPPNIHRIMSNSAKNNSGRAILGFYASVLEALNKTFVCFWGFVNSDNCLNDATLYK